MIKFKIDSKELQTALALLVQVTTKTTVSMFDNVQVSLNCKSLRLTTTNGYTQITKFFVLTEMEGEGEFYVNCKYLQNALKSLPKQSIELSLPKPNEIHIKHSGGRILLQPFELGTAQFPTTRQMDKSKCVSFSFPCKHLTDAVKKLFCAMADDDVRLVLNGMLLKRTTDSLTFVATDGRKIGRIIHELPDAVDDSFIISRQICAILKSISANTIKVWHEDSLVKMMFDSSLVIAFSSVEGNYPNYASVLPKAETKSHSFKANKPNIVSALARLQEFCNTATGLLVMQVEKDILTLRGRDMDLGFAIAEQVSIQDYEGEGVKVGLASPFVKEMVSTIDDVDISCTVYDFNGDNTTMPFAIHEESDKYSYLLMVMNMRIEEYTLWDIKDDDFSEETTDEVEEGIEDEEEPTEEECTGEIIAAKEEYEDINADESIEA